MERKTLKQRIENGETVIGTWCVIPSTSTVNIMAKAGLDFVIIDMEHGAMDFKLAEDMVMAAEADGCEALIRVARNDESDILRATETGASGILVPHIKNAGERKKAISYMFYPPKGVRGYSPFCRAGNYGADPDTIKKQNERILPGIILEDVEAISELKAIIDDEKLELVYIGTYDLSVSLGVPGEVKNPKVTKHLESMVEAIREKGKAVGCMANGPEDVEYFKKLGINVILYKVDSAALAEQYKNMGRGAHKR